MFRYYKTLSQAKMLSNLHLKIAGIQMHARVCFLIFDNLVVIDPLVQFSMRLC